MKIHDWKTIAELIGIAAIVVSLVFVGLQMNQAQKIAIAEQYQARADSAAEHMRWYMENDIMMAEYQSVIEGLLDSEESATVFRVEHQQQDPRYLATVYVQARTALMYFDNFYMQYQLGTMNEASWAAFRYRLKSGLRDEFFRWAFTNDPDQWRQPFQQLCRALISEIEREAEIEIVE